MKNLICLLLLFCLLPISGETARSVGASDKVSSYRPLGETRVWTFSFRDSTIGRLISTVAATAEVDSVSGLKFTEHLALNFSRLGSSLVMEVSSERTVSDEGWYLGDRISITLADQTERLELQREGEFLKGIVTRSGKEIEQSHGFYSHGMAVDNFMLDQYELFLAMHDLQVGDSIDELIFQPQAMISARIKGVIEDFVHKELWRGRFDSVFVIHLSQPQEQYLFFTADKRLVRFDIPGQGIRAYLDVVQGRSVPAPAAPAVETRAYPSLVPHFLLYLLLGLMAMLFFIGRAYRSPMTYLLFVAGGLVYAIMPFTQLPLQIALVSELLIPKVGAGGSIYLWALIPALAAGAIQEAAKLALVFLASTRLSLKLPRPMVIGAACGAGFGVVEGCYIATHVLGADLFSLTLVERGFMILYHTAGAALIGNMIKYDRKKLGAVVIGLILINGLLRYVPIFVQQQLIPVNLMYVVLALLVLMTLTVTLSLSRRSV